MVMAVGFYPSDRRSNPFCAPLQGIFCKKKKSLSCQAEELNGPSCGPFTPSHVLAWFDCQRFIVRFDYMFGLSIEPNRANLWFRFFPVELPVRSSFFHYASDLGWREHIKPDCETKIYLAWLVKCLLLTFLFTLFVSGQLLVEHGMPQPCKSVVHSKQKLGLPRNEAKISMLPR